MNQAIFENLMKFWRQAWDEEHKNLSSPKTATCLSFDALKSCAEGDCDVIQQSHVMTCSHCKNMVQFFKKHLETESPTVLEKLLAWKEAASARIREQWQGLGGEGRWAILKPALVGIPLAVIVAFLLLLLSRHERSLAELASIEPVPYQALQIRSGASADEGERLFEEGMAFYVQKDYSNAMAKLALATQLDSLNASFHFYLGLSYLLSDSVDLAIAHLQRAIALGGDSVLEKAYWYLGNAWLLKGDGTLALEAFRKVMAMEEDYQWEAQEIIGKIERLSRK